MFPMPAERLEARARALTDKASVALANNDYSPEDIMTMLVDALAIQRDTLEELKRYANTFGHPARRL